MLRANKESIIAIVDTFRYDPIKGWKLKSNAECSALECSSEKNGDC
jgi:phosphatidylinositol kinase/protein kinase (PI-3  family)